jgi:hypothetical protein
MTTTDMLSDPLQITLKVATVFEDLEIAYLIGGSLASSLYGVVRSTMDADLVADIQPSHVQSLYEQLNDEFYIDTEMVLNAISRNTSFSLIHFETTFKIDVFILQKRAFDQNRMQRRILRPIGDPQVGHAYFSSAEDMILAKLEWFRAGSEISDQQWRDILGVLKMQSGQLDMDYLKLWATTLGVEDLLERAISQI